VIDVEGEVVMGEVVPFIKPIPEISPTVVDESLYFRYGTGAVIINESGDILMGRRAGSSLLQLPQGGIHPGETEVEGVYREIEEETGLTKSEINLVGVYPHLLSYLVHKPSNPEKIGVGQVQKWFFFRLINFAYKANPTKELVKLDWVSPETLIGPDTTLFKRDTYRKLYGWMRGGGV
jgi:putative (di)nucleoside polyphosphate hydrolase